MFARPNEPSWLSAECRLPPNIARKLRPGGWIIARAEANDCRAQIAESGEASRESFTSLRFWHITILCIETGCALRPYTAGGA